MDRLSAVDVSFLTNESSSSHMHVGAIMIFEGPPPTYDDLVEHVRGRLPLVPRFRQKLAYPPAQTGRPFWIDDPTFNLEYHVRHSALPSPGSEEQLRRMAGRVFSQQLDRTKPLWELWLVQGLTRKRFALITKTHHALVDGASGVDIATVLFDLKPVPEPAEPDDDWVPEPGAVVRDPARQGGRGRAQGAGRRAPAGSRERSTHPEARGPPGRQALEGVGEIGWAFANPAPDVPLNVEIGSHRRFLWVRSDLAHFKTIKDALGGTVNDVVLAVVAARSAAGWVAGVRIEGLELRAQVPVSIRAQDEHGQLGNRLAVMRAPLPVYIEDPVARLRTVTAAMRGPQAVQAGAGRRGDLALQRLRAPHPARAGGADQLLDPALQPRRHERSRPPGSPLRARARARGLLPGRLPAAPPGPLRGDHELQRRDQLRLARRLRLDRRSRPPRGGIERAIAELTEAAESATRTPETSGEPATA